MSVDVDSVGIGRVVAARTSSTKDVYYCDGVVLEGEVCPRCSSRVVCIYAETEDDGYYVDNYLHVCLLASCGFSRRSENKRSNPIPPPTCRICERQINIE